MVFFGNRISNLNGTEAALPNYTASDFFEKQKT